MSSGVEFLPAALFIPDTSMHDLVSQSTKALARSMSQRNTKVGRSRASAAACRPARLYPASKATSISAKAFQ
jgi:hypothetical protein